jgi:uncharacterized DUF497 family protein
VAGLRFTWDQHKAAANVTKHGVTFEEARRVFSARKATKAEQRQYLERLKK